MIRTLLALWVLVFCPVFLVVLWYVGVACDGSFQRLLADGAISQMLHHLPVPTAKALGMVAAFVAFEALLLIGLPARRVPGPVTPAGEQVFFQYNGAAAWAVTHAAFFAWWYFAPSVGFSPAIIYDELGALIATLSVLAVSGSVVLYFKGLHFPSGPDAGSSGNFVFDYFWGTELYPRIGSLHLKQLINSRVGVMGWSLLGLSFAVKQHELSGHFASSMIVVVVLQFIYVAKFLFWEEGYFWSLDMTHDRFGWYLCWGVSTWLPVVYASQAIYLVTHPIALHPALAAFFVIMGLVAMGLTFDADSQRQRVRRTEGRTKVWGRTPDVIRAEYTAADGTRKTNLLLASGWWGVARHFNYTLEITLGLAWTLPAGFSSFYPFVYPVYVVILLAHRAMRDDQRCRDKYGASWDEYCRRVRWKIIPGIF